MSIESSEAVHGISLHCNGAYGQQERSQNYHPQRKLPTIRKYGSTFYVYVGMVQVFFYFSDLFAFDLPLALGQRNSHPWLVLRAHSAWDDSNTGLFR